MPGRKQFSGAAAETTLNGGITSGATSMVLTNAAGYPSGVTGPFVLVVGVGLATEEKMLCSATATNTISITTRGYDGTAASAHSSGETVRHVLDADTVNEANDHVNTTGRDDHTQYLNAARHAAVAHTGAMLTDLTVATADIADGAVTAAKMASEAWTSWTPVLTQSGAVTKTVFYAKYVKHGRLVVAQFSLAVTGSGSANSTVTVSLPVTAAVAGGIVAGVFRIIQPGTGLVWGGLATVLTTTTCCGVSAGNNVNVLNLGTTSSAFTAALASGDNVDGIIAYEAAP